MLFFDSFSENSRLKEIKTSQKFIFFLINIIIIFAFDNVYLCFISVIVLFSLNKYLVPSNHLHLFKLMIIPATFLLMGILPIIFSINAAKPLYSFNFFSITLGVSQTSLNYATLTLFKSLAIVLCSYFLILNTRMNNLFNFMHRVKVPVLLVNIFELTYRFIYIILKQTMKIRNAQEARLGYLSFRQCIVSLALMFKNTFIKSFERISNLQMALDSRLYSEEINYYIIEETFSKKFMAFSLSYWLIMLTIGWLVQWMH